jgi:hypothetical protein
MKTDVVSMTASAPRRGRGKPCDRTLVKRQGRWRQLGAAQPAPVRPAVGGTGRSFRVGAVGIAELESSRVGTGFDDSAGASSRSTSGAAA